MKDSNQNDFQRATTAIREAIVRSRYLAATQVNKELLCLSTHTPHWIALALKERGFSYPRNCRDRGLENPRPFKCPL